ncbi:Adenine phosphoribosyltransferase [Cercospora beticola]|uniref:Adenine phosphoribosyltransferase n=1 Tax=Cercospora beticola TaxID=122368 RepID=A0A2G5IDU7_CERBT|nr:Adenine phosphoribosyltransferase [Cercospora beticola]PIB03028.1 Adenine phosphoribosyltransferase [Cercospora beticola]WPB04304.1 hypothetical protein RHO25_008950 [Cercospora beticola]CAK1356880.1 unnamed protein product [Cercospora beticola]
MLIQLLVEVTPLSYKIEMATLDALKSALRRKVTEIALSPTRPLSDLEYDVGFTALAEDFGKATYDDFIIPQLSLLLEPLLNSRTQVSILEIGPGPKSVLAELPDRQKSKIKRYSAFEPNKVFATRLEQSFSSMFQFSSSLPNLQTAPDIRRHRFTLDPRISTNANHEGEGFDVILFCHSLYGMEPKRDFVEKALEMLTKSLEDGMVIVFHRQSSLQLDGLMCHRTASFPTGVFHVEDDDKKLDCFARFIAGVVVENEGEDETVRLEWRKEYRLLGRRESGHPNHLSFDAPNIMTALTIIGGGHSGHCLQPNVVAVDMGAFDKIHIVAPAAGVSDTVIVVGAGSKAGDGFATAMAAELTVPLGSRPSVGAGLWLQGGIGHLARLHSLTCDAILGAVVVSVASGQVFCVGQVPKDHQPQGAKCIDGDSDLLWALKGAGSNFAITVSVTFKASPARQFAIQNWVMPLNDKSDARRKLQDFDHLVASKLPQHCSADAYLYCENDKLRFGVSLCETFTTEHTGEWLSIVRKTFGPENGSQIVDGVDLFDTEMYVSAMHGDHAGGKTSSFKRCLFLKDISASRMVDSLIAALKSRPSPYCYFHLLHGGGAVSEVSDVTTAFGCRDWDFACVITGVWDRSQEDTDIARCTTQWVYDVAKGLLPISSGIYSADLGPDLRDADLAVKALGPNRPRLAHLKQKYDPENVLAYTCPLPKVPGTPKLIVLVTGEHGAGKDYSAAVWVSVFGSSTHKGLTARTVSISNATKREYAEVASADYNRLLEDRKYKEQHRGSLTAFFENQLHLRPQLAEEHFMKVVSDAEGVDVLFITGMRDEAPVAAFSHLVSHSRLLEVKVKASKETQRARRGFLEDDDDDSNDTATDEDQGSNSCPNLVFTNDGLGKDAAIKFAEIHLLPIFDDDLLQLRRSIRLVHDSPRPGFAFRDVLGICQQSPERDLCTTLLQKHFNGDRKKVDLIAGCETGGLVLGLLLATHLNMPFAMIRKDGERPDPKIAVTKSLSYVSSSATENPMAENIEMDVGLVSKGDRVVVVDDVLSTGETLCAVLQLLAEAGIDTEKMNVLVVAEFPAHRGRNLLRQRGFGGVNVQSLLVFGGE